MFAITTAVTVGNRNLSVDIECNPRLAWRRAIITARARQVHRLSANARDGESIGMRLAHFSVSAY
jgi:hypothetical protein